MNAAHPDAELIAACSRIIREYGAFNQSEPPSGEEAAEAERFFASIDDLLDQIRDLKAVTADGVVARARALECANPSSRNGPAHSFDCGGIYRMLEYLLRDAAHLETEERLPSAATPTPLMLLGQTLDEIKAIETAHEALSIANPEGARQSLGDAVTAREKAYLAAIDAAAISRAQELPDLLPQLGSAFDRIDSLLDTQEGSALGEDLKAVRYALASALVVLDETIPQADRCCKHLVDAAVVRGFDLGQRV